MTQQDDLETIKLLLQEKQDTLDWVVSVTALGTWEWDIKSKVIRYNDEYLKMLGLSQKDMNGTMEEWKALRHPEDLPRCVRLLEECLSGKTPVYECEVRIKRHDGSYFWTRDMGKIIARDSAGLPSKLFGGHLNMDELKLLGTINQVSKMLLTVQAGMNFESVVKDCLSLLGKSINKGRVYIWKDSVDLTGRDCCSQIYEWGIDGMPEHADTQFKDIPYSWLPAFQTAMKEERCLNSLLRDLSESEKNILKSQSIKTILIAPININGKRWGFIGVDDYENEQLFTNVEENMLLMSGSMLANAIERMETEAALREMEERTQIMLNATPLCCNLWTPDFFNMRCNDEAVRLFELTSQQEYLDRFHELSPEYQPNGKNSGELAIEYITKAFREGYCRFEWQHQKLDGTPVPAEITLVRIKYKDDFIVAGYTRDLREEKAMLAELKTKEALRRARDEALLNSQAKSNFLANMSHEIRTPMNAISGFAEMILRESKEDKTTEYAQGIKGACGSLINLINDILDISKIESGKLEISSAPYELASLINDVIAISRMRLGSKPLMFITDIDSRLPAHLVGDEVRVKQILLNILSNAIKYTNEGYLELNMTGTVQGNEALLRISVTDSGIGIMPEDLSRLFDEFQRVNTTKNRSVEGTGLGLAITKQLCEMMGGHIEVESTFGKGSVFTVVIRQECPDYERLAQVKQEKKVLVYEPRELYRFSIVKSLMNLDCQCISCSSQSELYHCIGSMTYDYILTDAMHLKKVRSIVTKNKLKASVAVFVDCGKEVKDAEVDTIMLPANCLQLSSLLNGPYEEERFSLRSGSGYSFTAPAARVLIVDDNPVNLQVARGLMEPYLFPVDTATNGREAVEMIQKEQYDLVFMDHMMPEMDGVDATVAIRKLQGEYFQTLPIIALTANAIVGTREMFIREGMNDFLAKPVDTNKLANLLSKWLPQSKLVNEAPAKSAGSGQNTKAISIVGVDTALGIRSVGGREADYLKILSVYHADGMTKCSSLLRHFTEHNISAFRTEVHALKSTSAVIGALQTASMAAKMEEAAQKNDISYIDYNLAEFLSCLHDVLDAVIPVLRNCPEQMSADEDKPSGTIEGLRDLLDVLRDALEFANIRIIEDQTKSLNQFLWPDKIDGLLKDMQECLNVFDYDGALECLNLIQSQLDSNCIPFLSVIE